MSSEELYRSAEFQEHVCYLPVACLRTSFSSLRAGSHAVGPECELRPMPLRVVASDEGYFDIIDGFKRFSTWVGEGKKQVPVVIESPGTRPEHKRLLLLANAPRRMLTPLDEGCVIRSMIEEDGLTVPGVAKLLGRKKTWVSQRAALIDGLTPLAKQKVASGEIGPTLAHHLTTLAKKEQDELLDCFSRHPLRQREQLVVLQGYRAGDAFDRKRLLAAPLSLLSPDPSPALSLRVHAMEKRLGEISQAISDLGSFRIPSDLAPAECRRLEALIQALLRESRKSLSELDAALQSPSSTTITPVPSGACNIPSHHEERNVSNFLRQLLRII